MPFERGWPPTGDQQAKPCSWKWHLFRFKMVPGYKQYSTATATVRLLSLSVSLSLRYAAIWAFCLINNLSVMYWMLALIQFSVRCVGRKLPPPSLLPSLHKVAHAHFWLCIYGCRDEDERAILKGLQLHLNGIIRHDGWRLPFHNV